MPDVHAEPLLPPANRGPSRAPVVQHMHRLSPLPPEVSFLSAARSMHISTSDSAPRARRAVPPPLELPHFCQWAAVTIPSPTDSFVVRIARHLSPFKCEEI